MFLPDFTTERHFEQYSAYPIAGKPGVYGVTPARLLLASEDDLPALRLTLVRAMDPAPRMAGILAARLRLEYDDDAARRDLSNGGTPATILPILPEGGWLRLDLQGQRVERALTWNGLAQSALRMPLDAGMAGLLRQALSDGTMPVQGIVVLSLRGMAARAPVVVSFDPAAIVTSMAAAVESHGGLTYAALRAWVARGWEELPLRWSATGAMGAAMPWDAMRVALLDRLMARYASLALPQAEAQSEQIVLGGDVTPGEVTLRLDDESTSWRPLSLAWHPLQVVRPFIERQGVTPFLNESESPPLPRGSARVELTGNLPPACAGLLSVGAHLRLPPRPPLRPQPQRLTATLDPPDYTATVTFRLALGESLHYELRPFMVLLAGEEVLEIDGPPRESTVTAEELTVADFPAQFTPLSAERNLLDLAAVSGEVRWRVAERERAMPVRLSAEQPAVTIVLPQDVSDASAHLTLTTRDGTATLEAAPLPLEEGYLLLAHLPSYGAHRIRFTRDAAPGPDLSVDVEAEDGSAAARLTLRRDRPEAEWGYVALDPFRAGYRYRVLPDGAWSELLSPMRDREVRLP